ncbi:DNA-binding protein [bacterium]|nr:DNA-binding protein [bacterium]
MEFKKIENSYVLRLDPGEEIIVSIKKFCELEKIHVGSISAIGAVNKVEIGYFETAKKEYHSTVKKGDFEILNLSGNIASMDDEVYLHLHISIAGSDLCAYGGHLNHAIVSATCEVFIDTLNGKLDRSHDEKTGLNLLHF